MADLQKMLSFVRKAVENYDMIRDGDIIGVGVSAGKDSLSLLVTLSELRKFYPEKFTLKAITVDMGFPDADFSKIKELCDNIGVEYTVIPSQIYEIIFNVRKETNPCSLCARMRRGAINDAAKALGCNKLALGHNYDDVVETVLLNLFYAGRFGSFQPVTYLDRSKLFVIRPLIYAPEREVAAFARNEKLPVIESKCPANGNTEREEMKKFMYEMQKSNRSFIKNIFGALERAPGSGYEMHTRTQRTKSGDAPQAKEE